MSTPSVQPGPSFTSGALAQLLGGTLIGRADLDLSGFDQLDSARHGQLTFIRNERFAGRWAQSRASAALVSAGVEVPGHDPGARALIVVPDADLALVSLAERFAPAPAPRAPGVDPSAQIDPGARIDPTAHVGALCVIGPGTRVEAGAVLHARVTLGTGVLVGERTTLYPGVVVLDRCEIGPGCTLWPNAVIGSDGFAYRPGPTGPVKIPHAGNVVIGSGVEIGAGSTIDRARFGSTRLGDACKIDNLVQVGHNCVLGRGVILCGCVGLAGSVKIGDGAVIGGGAGIADNISIGAGAQVAANAGVMRDVGPGEIVSGSPAMPARLWARMQVALKRLGEGRGRA